MNNLRKYGSPPYNVAVIHGGPGAPGYMAPVARELSARRGVLEPLQTARALAGQVEELHLAVWQDAKEFRRYGALLWLGKQIQCPVLAIHGDYDPHPAEGVEKPLSGVLQDFRFILLADCGHLPWIEKEAREEFYRIVE